MCLEDKTVEEWHSCPCTECSNIRIKAARLVMMAEMMNDGLTSEEAALATEDMMEEQY